VNLLLPLAAKKVGMSGQQTVAILILIVMGVGFLLFVIMTLAHRDPGAPPGSEVELAPNRRPYFDDEVLEGPRLDRALWVALGMLVIVAISLPAYWLLEPTRQKGAQRGFDGRAVERGGGLFALTTDPRAGLHFNCAGCHGVGGVGGSTLYVVPDPQHPDISRQVSWSVPPLNTVLLRFTESEVLQILTYGRAGTPMPPWGVAGGGAMDDQQLSDLVAYIRSIQLTPAAAKDFWAKQAATTAKTLHSVDGAGNPIITGLVLFDTNCARCHTKGYSYGEPLQQGGGGQYGPNITNGSEIRQFPVMQDQVDFVTNGVDPGKGYGTGGIMTNFGGGMPHFGAYLSPQEIGEIVAYERSL
jgi:mono/diheme cytochrome c family protein